MASGCCGEIEELEVVYHDTMDVSFGGMSGDLMPRVEFGSLPGYKSCIQAGNTIQSDKEYWERFKKEKKDEPKSDN
jgi:hypothetical protein